MADSEAGPSHHQAADPDQPPNRRRRHSGSLPSGAASRSSQPDAALDHDSTAASARSHTKTDQNYSSSSHPPDVDTCRICRGEGTPDEPLYYPCKCSGSIKYVHQDCLMTWLSHSQKKHCELCKTPFRFTKLYAPNMPNALPFHIFITHVAQYILRNMLVWLRAGLVISVWLGWLPYIMRYAWSFLFWISDDGFGRNTSIVESQDPGSLNSTTHQADLLLLAATVGTCPASPLLPVATCSAFTSVASQVSQDSIPRLVRALYAINITKSENRYAAFLRLVFGGIDGVHDTSSFRAAASRTPPPSLLSDVSFLRNLSRYPSVNSAVIAILEGQIITILVIVCFILIILVRDYVIQQQPEINMRAEFGGDEEMLVEQVGDRIHLGNADAAAGRHEPDQEDVDQAEDWVFEEDNNSGSSEDLDPMLMMSTGSILGTAGDNIDASGPPDNLRDDNAPAFQPDSSYPHSSGESNGSSVSQGDISDNEETNVSDFSRIYREAAGDAEQLLKLAKEEHLDEKLNWLIKVARDKSKQQNNTETDIGPSADDQSMRQHDEVQSYLSGDKGKGRANEEDETAALSETITRPRANTDGPKVTTSVNPLAYNTWSFANLPTEEAGTDGDAFVADLNPIPDSTNNTYSSGSMHAQVSFTGGQHGANVPEMVSSDFEVPHPDLTEGTTQPDDPSFDFNTPPGLGVRAPPRRQPAGLVDWVADFMWGDVEAIDPAELVPLHVHEELHEDEPAPFLDAIQDADMLVNDERDREVVEAAVAAGLDPDAIEDAEDLEGILELVGMRGPITGLLQNGLFCAFLVAVTLLFGVFLPYNIGRVTVWTLANPMRIVRMLFSLSKFTQDLVVISFGLVFGVASYIAGYWVKLLPRGSASTFIDNATVASFNLSSNAAARVVMSFKTEMPILSANEIRNFSALSHDALLTLKSYIAIAFFAVGHAAESVFSGSSPNIDMSGWVSWVSGFGSVVWGAVKEIPHTLSDPSSWVINLSLPESVDTVNPELAFWGGMDRFWAILCGYVALSVFGALYLRRGVPFSSSALGQDLETSLLDSLRQASGVMKVILIIGIEMLVFPLYCGLLLDVALLPLFENTTVKSRILFTLSYPLTSIFVHWFVGTGYMFHFALFVSMCRKIMRRGVLYFIRDPDDPDFHPVRDVLERNVTTQLRKILFSAFVYGALVIICLGGVVWGLCYSIPNVLPIHYSSNEPVFEFPIDLLFYNFMMPLGVRFFKPSDGLHAMYTWWFRKCARALRLTWFLFGERRIDEEGKLVVPTKSRTHKLPWFQKIFLEVDHGKVIPKKWDHFFEGGKAKPAAQVSPEAHTMLQWMKDGLVKTGQLIPDGRFVRAPSSDQVKIPKGKPVFLEVNAYNQRLDGKPDDSDTDIYANPLRYSKVYIPPFFRLRIFLFILFIWVFAAFTGVSITIVPLIFGRAMLKLLTPAHVRTNDIYAFSIGIYVLGSLTYSVSHARSILLEAESWSAAVVESVARSDALRRLGRVALNVSRLLYAYCFLLVVFPMMVVSVMELYLLIPLNTWMYSPVFSTPALPAVDDVSGKGIVAAASVANINPKHTVRLIQAWTIGVLYLKLGARLVSSYYEDTRLSAAVRAVLRRGWADPDVAVLTCAFVIPGFVIWATLVSVPLLVGRMLVAYGATESIIAAVADSIPAHRGIVVDLDTGSDAAANLVRTDQLDRQLANAVTVLIYRISYPLTALAVAIAAGGWNMIDTFKGWKVRIRDEAYLIGERLHNFGAGNGPARAGGAWRAGGARL